MLNRLTAWVVGGDTRVCELLESSGMIDALNGGQRFDQLDKIHMIVFTGGEDIHPEFYGQKNVHSNWLNEMRDQEEIDIFMKTRDTHYHFGICRGLQLLAILNGAKLWQDITGHNGVGSHAVKIVKCGSDRWLNKTISMTSVHHQAIRATAALSKNNILAFSEHIVTARGDSHIPTTLWKVPEVAWFEGTRSFGVQGHPEYPSASDDFKEYVLHQIIEDIDTGYYANLQRGRA